MKKIITFNLNILYRNKTILILPIILLIIAVAGVLSGKWLNPKVSLYNLYSIYIQFLFIVLTYITISNLTNDFQKGIYRFLIQVGYSVKKCFISKVLILYFITFLISNFIFIIYYFYLTNYDFNYLLLTLIPLNLTIIYILLFCIFLALTIRKTLPAVLIGFAIFIISDVLNVVLYGLANQADYSSLTTTTLGVLSEQNLNLNSIANLHLDFNTYKYFLVIIPTSIWIIVLLICDIILLKRKGVKNGL